MPDTGAPWNIPYVAGTDLVSDWPTDSQALATAIADGLDAAPNAGIGSNVVQAVKTDVFTTTSTSFTTVTGLTASITPTSASSKVLVVVQINLGGKSSGTVGHTKITRGGTDIYVGDAASNRVRASIGGFTTESVMLYGFSIVYLDSPATTSSTTYQVEMRTNTGTVYVNRSETDSDNAGVTRGASSITVMEVAG